MISVIVVMVSNVVVRWDCFGFVLVLCVFILVVFVVCIFGGFYSNR